VLFCFSVAIDSTVEQGEVTPKTPSIFSISTYKSPINSSPSLCSFPPARGLDPGLNLTELIYQRWLLVKTLLHITDKGQRTEKRARM